ncbi:GPI ethanolamine phosphate transferase 3 isoform X2 [Asparagus officinalis]|nr:GPI ethanolamine phosphate transferase 3 isoform X2 [Asparagus officinalis]XP_020257448.1 GPI ethanolamine phosphate transferase 3 isoform X2 [Asparagus officinalis]
MDKLPVLQKLASGENATARIFKAIADPPTTSLQRLKGLTTGGLPTFIDIGNSFGAPAIIEDNLLYQLSKNGKRVLMMGDDTWMQLFPDHFERSYPYPSFNVKDLDTVDNGCVEHLLPSLQNEDWDVLIAHFLGMDHAGHIFSVDSTPMVQKLEQYNNILEEVIEVMRSQSGPGGLHENTLLLVMGDHGQTISGDHGGGTAEEIETSLFAMSMRAPPDAVLSVLDAIFCKVNLAGEKTCISSIQQLDFAATVAALLGIPFPFGSIGRVNHELYALSAGTWGGQRNSGKNCNSRSNLEEWMQNYVNALCVNSWQVKRYIDIYSVTSVIGLPSEDLSHIRQLYTHAQDNWSNITRSSCLAKNDIPYEDHGSLVSTLQKQIDAYSKFLESVATLARSAWTEFDLILMGVGLIVMLASLFVHLLAIRRVHVLCQSCYTAPTVSFISLRSIVVYLLVLMRGASFLSNSYILAEGIVANFLLATTGILNLSCSIADGKFAIEELLFLFINIILRLGIEFGISKQTAGSTSLSFHFLSILPIDKDHPVLIGLLEIFPIFILFVVAFVMFKCSSTLPCRRCIKFCFVGTVLSYILIAVHWVSESNVVNVYPELQDFGKNIAPRLVYAIGFGLLVLLVLSQIFYQKATVSDSTEKLAPATAAMVSAWSSAILILLGKRGSFVALICIGGAWCIIKSQKPATGRDITKGNSGVFFTDPVNITQWSLLAVCLFFYTGHWCAFDGLRYGAAFIGFEHFNIIRQGLLLVIDTFGVSFILPILGLPFLVGHPHQSTREDRAKDVPFFNLTKVFLSYGLITAVTTTFTIICVTIQRRHLMVWGLFAPKYVFDVLGLLLTDVLICCASLLYY